MFESCNVSLLLGPESKLSESKLPESKLPESNPIRSGGGDLCVSGSILRVNTADL